jgi:DNA (cytosine-5)-methyltransferase 1
MSFTSGRGSERLRVAGLFSGIGGIELGFERAGHAAELLCEVWEPARAVLAQHFPQIPLEGDVRRLAALPEVDIVAAGFPCTDLSQAGRTAGISGRESSLVGEVFRLVKRRHPRWLVLENVHNMLPLDRGRAMRYLVDELEDMRYRWAYRVVNSQFTGVPQRRYRVLLVASRTDDPRGVLFTEDAGEPQGEYFNSDAFGFYWTEGLRGLGWAQDAIPPLKGGSSLGIPSPPGVWLPYTPLRRRLVKPSIADAERLQGFPAGWTGVADGGPPKGPRWKLVGNAVTVGVAAWLGERLGRPGDHDTSRDTRLEPSDRWPTAAWGSAGERWASPLSKWPRRAHYQHLTELLDVQAATPLSHRAAAGFFERMGRAKLVFDESFKLDVKRYVELTAATTDVADGPS